MTSLFRCYTEAYYQVVSGLFPFNCFLVKAMIFVLVGLVSTW